MKSGSAVAGAKEAGALASDGKKRAAAAAFTGHRDLSPAEVDAVKTYQGFGHKSINDFLRGKRDAILPDLQARIPALASAVDKGVLNRDMKLFRGMHLDLNVDAMKLVGTTISDPSFASTSLSRKVARRFGELTVEFTAPRGTKGLAVHKVTTGSAFGHGGSDPEHEVLLPRGSSLKILSVRRRQGGGYHAMAELSQ